MTTVTTRNGVQYLPATVMIPLITKVRARQRGISLSKTLTEALEDKMNVGDTGAKQLPTNEAPCIPSSTRDEVDKL